MLLAGLSLPSDHNFLEHRNMSKLSLCVQSSAHGQVLLGDIADSLETDILEDRRTGRALCIIVQQPPGLEPLSDFRSQPHMSLQGINFFTAEAVI